MTKQPTGAADSVPALTSSLRETGYLADEGLATVAWLALRMRRPLLVEGEPGTGKTALAEALSDVLAAPLIRLQCYEGIDVSQALYDWDFPRQILHLRTVEATRDQGAELDPEAVEESLFDERFPPSCSSTRSTGLTTSSRPSCSRCCRRIRSASRNSAR